jgi:hypothetical protein
MRNTGQAHDPATGEPAGCGASHDRKAGALNDHIRFHVDVSGIAAVVGRA